MTSTAAHPFRIRFEPFNLNTVHAHFAWLEHRLRALAGLRRIDEAIVRLERYPDASPAYRVKIHLVTPGPDVVAECHDHTLRAAATKALARAREIVANRSFHRVHHRRKDRTSPPARTRA